MKRKPYTPTRTCPHRWCKPLHLAPLPFFLALVAFQLWNNLIFLFLIASGLIGATVLSKLTHYKPRPRSEPATFKDVVQDIREAPTAIDLEMEDAKYEGTGWRMLEVRKWWARIAVGCDALVLLLIGSASVATFTSPAEEAQRLAAAEMDLGMVISMVVGLTFMGFTMYAHKKATQPRKPKRAWVPAFLRTNT